MTEKTFRAKKSLGQNFLKSTSALQKIISAGEISKKDIVLEIGPGKGALTELLLEKAQKVIAVETDYALFDLLKEKFAKEISGERLVLVQSDILHFDISKCAFAKKNYKIIANIPYNITGAILKKFLTAENQPERMVLMVQKEVAKRIMEPKGSLLSVSVKVYGTPRMVAKVPARYFSPQPKVDSSIIKIEDISRENFAKNGVSEEDFWKIVRAGFRHKRKKLQNNLKSIVSKEKLANLGLGSKRAEELSPKEWFALVKA
jgi:16S rRNA (adenine1518-N6/adenine1519-N6)-dimethyltransferase